MRMTALFVLAFVVSNQAAAQIIAIHFKKESTARKYKKYVVDVNGEYVLAGEIRRGGGIRFDPGAGITYRGKKTNEIMVANPGDPLDVPYELDGERRVRLSKRSVIAIEGPLIRRISVLMRDQTLAGLAHEYALRLEKIDSVRAKRDRFDVTTNDWFEQHRRLLAAYEGLHTWLAETLYRRAAKKVEKTILKELRRIKDDALRERARKAKESVRTSAVPEGLAAASRALSEGRHQFGAQESQHCRIIYLKGPLKDAAVKRLLELAETIIEGFRRNSSIPTWAMTRSTTRFRTTRSSSSGSAPPTTRATRGTGTISMAGRWTGRTMTVASRWRVPAPGSHAA